MTVSAVVYFLRLQISDEVIFACVGATERQFCIFEVWPLLLTSHLVVVFKEISTSSSLNPANFNLVLNFQI